MEQSVMRMPRTVDIDLTARCNLQCRYCYFFGNPEAAYSDLPTVDWLRLFDELGRLGVINAVLAGGEPFLRPDLCELIDGLVRNRMRFSLLSNGTLITDATAAHIASTGRCNYVQISIDGSRPETHDACRGAGSFEGAVRGFHALQRHGVKPVVRVTIHRHNVRDLEETARFLLEDLGLSSFSTNSAGYLGLCRINTREVMLNTAEHMLAMETLLRLTEKYPGRITANAGPLADARTWARMLRARDERQPAFSNGGRLTACGCTNSKIAIRCDGAVIPCNMLAHMELGRINEHPLADLWLNHPVLNSLRSRRSIELSSFAFCAGCDFIPYCTGNCPGAAYTLTGRVDHPSPDACLRRFLQDGGRVCV